MGGGEGGEADFDKAMILKAVDATLPKTFSKRE